MPPTSRGLILFIIGAYIVLIGVAFIYDYHVQAHPSGLLNAILCFGGVFAALGAYLLEKNAPFMWGILRLLCALSFIGLFTYDTVYWLSLARDVPASSRYIYAGVCGALLLSAIGVTVTSARKHPFFPRKSSSAA